MCDLQSKELRAKLRASEPEVQAYVRALTHENAKLQRLRAENEAKNMTAYHRILALENHYKKEHSGDAVDHSKQIAEIRHILFGHIEHSVVADELDAIGPKSPAGESRVPSKA